MHLTDELRDRLSIQLCQDADFLASINCIDYSLLVGIYNSYNKISRKKRLSSRNGTTDRLSSQADSAQGAASEELEEQPGQAEGEHERLLSDEAPLLNSLGGLDVVAVEGPAQYYVAEWDWLSRLEHWVKTRLLCQSVNGISCQPPNVYASRFKQRVVKAIVGGRSELLSSMEGWPLGEQLEEMPSLEAISPLGSIEVEGDTRGSSARSLTV